MNHYTLNTHGTLLDLSTPQVMGILNVTPDSFYAQSRMQTDDAIRQRCRRIVDEGASIIDVGGYSSRPDAEHISAEEEMERLRRALRIVREECPEAIVSVDTFRADVAERCVGDYGVGIINDISGGMMDERMFSTVARLRVPYVMMHMQGTPQTMQHNPHYGCLVEEVFTYFAERIDRLHDMGANDIILDPGFGFGKTLEHNYELMACLEEFIRTFDLPLLVGVSRKSMVYRLLGCTPDEALPGTTALHAAALMKGAHILRVHDVKAAADTVRVVQAIRDAAASNNKSVL